MNPYSEQPTNYGQAPYPPPPYPVTPEYYQPVQRQRPEIWRIIGIIALVWIVAAVIIGKFGFFLLLFLAGMFFVLKRRGLQRRRHGTAYSRRHRYDADPHYYTPSPYNPTQSTQSQPSGWPAPTEPTGEEHKY